MGKPTVTMKKDDQMIICNDDEASRRVWADAGYEAVKASDEPVKSDLSKDEKNGGDGKKDAGVSGTDPVDAMTENELRAAIKEKTGKYPVRGATVDGLRKQYRVLMTGS